MAIISPIVSVARGLWVGSWTPRAAMSASNASMFFSATSSEVVPSSLAFLIILSSTSV